MTVVLVIVAIVVVVVAVALIVLYNGLVKLRNRIEGSATYRLAGCEFRDRGVVRNELRRRDLLRA